MFSITTNKKPVEFVGLENHLWNGCYVPQDLINLLAEFGEGEINSEIGIISPAEYKIEPFEMLDMEPLGFHVDAWLESTEGVLLARSYSGANIIGLPSRHGSKIGFQWAGQSQIAICGETFWSVVEHLLSHLTDEGCKSENVYFSSWLNRRMCSHGILDRGSILAMEQEILALHPAISFQSWMDKCIYLRERQLMIDFGNYYSAEDTAARYGWSAVFNGDLVDRNDEFWVKMRDLFLKYVGDSYK